MVMLPGTCMCSPLSMRLAGQAPSLVTSDGLTFCWHIVVHLWAETFVQNLELQCIIEHTGVPAPAVPEDYDITFSISVENKNSNRFLLNLCLQ